MCLGIIITYRKIYNEAKPATVMQRKNNRQKQSVSKGQKRVYIVLIYGS